jgi:hypothetical protein
MILTSSLEVPPADIHLVGSRSGCQQRGCLQVFHFITVYLVRFSSFGKQQVIVGRRRLICFFMYSYFLEVILCLYYPGSASVFVFLNIYQIWDTLLSVVVKKLFHSSQILATFPRLCSCTLCSLLRSNEKAEHLPLPFKRKEWATIWLLPQACIRNWHFLWGLPHVSGVISMHYL